ncbi:Plug domain-containing protein [Flagellimonas sediminis]|uniref:TonB-dependent receptor plug domain-containing protein n=1 Tax=Flagellimonas sediminis TaxID=2696468 RepID=A0A6I5KZQ9_9FLAO|nr:Plug domain-containing protein [Allomuricauda sediminis]NDV42350.1 TonB-dependent receptor plug domain-containing protein [Allomuricauda sediminis]
MKSHLLCILVLLLLLTSCSSNKNATYDKSHSEELAEKNARNIPLIDRIRKMPGITLRNGVPHFLRNSTQFFDSGTEPLYVLNGTVMGNSFQSINQLVDSFNVKRIQTIAGSDAAEYGARGGNGVIKITTYN